MELEIKNQIKKIVGLLKNNKLVIVPRRFGKSEAIIEVCKKDPKAALVVYAAFAKGFYIGKGLKRVYLAKEVDPTLHLYYNIYIDEFFLCSDYKGDFYRAAGTIPNPYLEFTDAIGVVKFNEVESLRYRQWENYIPKENNE